MVFTADYVVGEEENQFEVCAALSGAIEIDVVVVLSAQEHDQLLPNTTATSRLLARDHFKC